MKEEKIRESLKSEKKWDNMRKMRENRLSEKYRKGLKINDINR